MIGQTLDCTPWNNFVEQYHNTKNNMNTITANTASCNWDGTINNVQVAHILNTGCCSAGYTPKTLYGPEHCFPEHCDKTGPLNADAIRNKLDAILCFKCIDLCNTNVGTVANPITINYITYCVERTKDARRKLHGHLSFCLSKRVKRAAAQRIMANFANNIHVKPIANIWLTWLYKLKGDFDWDAALNRNDFDVPTSSSDSGMTVSKQIVRQFPNYNTKDDTNFKTILNWCIENLIDTQGTPFGYNCNAGCFGMQPMEDYHINDGDFDTFSEHLTTPFTLPIGGSDWKIGRSQAPKRKHSATTSNDEGWVQSMRELTLEFIDQAKYDKTLTLRHLILKMEQEKKRLFFIGGNDGLLNQSKWCALKDMCGTHFTTEIDSLREKKGAAYIYDNFKGILPHYTEWADEQDDRTLWNQQFVGPSGHGKTFAFNEIVKQVGLDPDCDKSVWRTMFRNGTFSGFGFNNQPLGCIEEVPPPFIKFWYKDILQAAETSPWGCRKAHSSDAHIWHGGALFYVNTLPILIVYLRYVQEIADHNGFDAGLDPQQLNRRFQRMCIVYMHGILKPENVLDEYLRLGNDGIWRSFVNTEYSFKMTDGKWYLHEQTLRKITEAGALKMLTKPRNEGGWDIDPTTGELSPALPACLNEQAAS